MRDGNRLNGDIRERIRDALQYIPADDRDTWVQIGMAIKAGLGDEGFDIWDSWSQGSESYDPRAARDVWRSINGTGGITEATLFRMAIEHGWREAIETSRAEKIWASASPAPSSHPYLVRKGVKSHGLRLHKGALVIPVRDGEDLASLQFIGEDGEKRFLTGGRVKGCYFLIGKQDGALCIAEGYATAASVHEATDYAVAVAFNAGNLLPVARALRAKFPDLRLTVCADDDISTPGNPGLTKAREAAQAVGALLAVPDFGKDRPSGVADFNDLRGDAAVRECIAQAVGMAREMGDGEQKLEVSQEIIDGAPGIMQPYIEWYLSRARCPEPVYAMASAIAFVTACVAARRYTDDVYLNTAVLTLGPTESGKDSIPVALEKCLSAIGGVAAIQSYYRAFGSAEGLWWTMNDGMPVMYFNRELGKYIESARNDKLKTNIFTAMIELHDLVLSERVKGLQYSKRQKKDVETMEDLCHPFLSVHGTGTDQTYGALKNMAAEDGSLNRFLILNCEGSADTRASFDNPAVPAALIEFAKSMGGIQKEVRWDDGVKEYQKERVDAIKHMVREAPGTWGRYGIKSSRMALMACACRRDMMIKHQDMEWACDLVEQCARIASEKFMAYGGLAASDTEALTRGIERLCAHKQVKKNGGIMTRRILGSYCRAWRGANIRDRDAAIGYLVKADILRAINGGWVKKP